MPEAQVWHPVCPEPENWPEGQLRHAVAPELDMYVPGLHSLQLDDPELEANRLHEGGG